MNLHEIQTKNKSQKSVVTLEIILINAVVFVLLFSGLVLNENVLLNPNISIVLEKPWTLLTVFFTHENGLHLVANMLLFMLFGKALEELEGSKALLLVYMLAGLFGSIGALSISYFINETEPMLGASAAVFGVVSAVGVISPKYRIINTNSKLLKSLFSATAMQYTLILLSINILLAIFSPSISISAVVHTIGILVGAICGWLLREKRSKMVNVY